MRGRVSLSSTSHSISPLCVDSILSIGPAPSLAGVGVVWGDLSSTSATTESMRGVGGMAGSMWLSLEGALPTLRAEAWGRGGH